MNSIMLQTCSRIVKPLMLLFSVFLLLRGHNEPGGGFVGGLVAGTAFCLHALAYSPQDAAASLHFRPKVLAAIGLLLAGISGCIGLFWGFPFLTGVWREVTLPLAGDVKLGTPLLFDAGVYLVVLGIATLIVLTLMEEQEWK
ncbi:MAG: Na+/H+ antiporter subunit B [Candidatus Hydrogenedentes bacterium]|nr:Na+/H+ antiporter subunit B [Candidatus Hydrogenedentota bacterium]